MKSLSKKEFESECKKLQFRGKCAILLRNNKMQEISRVQLEYKNSKLLHTQELQKVVNEHTLAVLVNFEISPKFAFVNVEKVMCELFKYLPEDIDLTITAIYDEKKEEEHAKVTVVLSQTSKLKILFSKIFHTN